MEVILDLPTGEQILSRLKPIEPGWTVFNWGSLNDHWWEEGNIPPDVEPTDYPWADVVAKLQGQDPENPLVAAQVIRITERPYYQNGNYGFGNNSPFGGDIVIVVVSPDTLELIGRRQRVNPTTEDVETESVRYDVFTDRVLTVFDARGNEISGDDGLAYFPFFNDRFTQNKVGDGGWLRFNDQVILPAEPGALGAFTGQVRGNAVDGRVTLTGLDMFGNTACDLIFNANTVPAGVEFFDVWGGYHDGEAYPNYRIYTGNLLGAEYSLPAPGGAFRILMDQCRITDRLFLNDVREYGLMTEFVAVGKELTPENSTLEAATLLVEGADFLNMEFIPWAGLVKVVVENEVPGGTRDISFLYNGHAGRNVTLRTRALVDLKFIHDPGSLIGYQGEDTTLHIGLDERATFRFADDGTPTIVNLETYTPPVRGHIIVQEDESGNQTIFPQRKKLVLVGAGFQVEDDEQNDATRVINLGGPADGGGDPGPEGRGYLATATSAAVTVQASLVGATVNFTIDVAYAGKVAYSAGARVRATLPGGAFVEGVATGYNQGTRVLPVLIDLYGGGATGSAWTLNLAGEPFRFTAGTVVYSDGKASLDLTSGQEFTVDLNAAGLGGSNSVALDLIGGWPAVRSIQIYLKQRPAAPFRTLTLQPGKFRVSNGVDVGVPLNRQAANAVDLITGYFYLADKNSGRCSLVFGPNFQDV